MIDANGAVARHVVIEPTSAQPPAGETQPSADEPTGGNPAGNINPGSEEKPGDEVKPSNDSALTPDQSPKPDAKPAATSTKMLATKTAEKTKLAPTPAAALPKTGDGDWAVAYLAFASLGMQLLCLALLAAK